MEVLPKDWKAQRAYFVAIQSTMVSHKAIINMNRFIFLMGTGTGRRYGEKMRGEGAKRTSTMRRFEENMLGKGAKRRC